MPQTAGKVLVVDDLPQNTTVLSKVLQAKGYTVCVANDGSTALLAVEREMPDVVLLDVMMPGMDGFEVCRAIKSNPATRLTPVVLVTGLGESDARIKGIEAGADDFLTKPPVFPELVARVRSLVRLKRYTDELETAEALVMSLAMTVEARDHYTLGHCGRLARYATALGQHLGLPEEDLAALYRGGYLHDLGKVGIPDAVLLKHGPLTADERSVMRQHPLIGERLCRSLKSLTRVLPIIRYHHERPDGSGYPDGLSGQQIPLLAQIISVVDVFDALTTTRPYRELLDAAQAMNQLALEAAQGWLNLVLVQQFGELVREGRLPPEGAEETLRQRFAGARFEQA